MPEGSAIIGKTIRELDEMADKAGVDVVGMIRRGKRMAGLSRDTEIRAGDVLAIEASPDSLEEAIGMLGGDESGVRVERTGGGGG